MFFDSDCWNGHRDGGILVDKEDCDNHEGVMKTILPGAGLFQERNHGGPSCQCNKGWTASRESGAEM